MRIGIRDNCLRLGALEALPLAKELGFDGVEICIGQDTSQNILWQDGGAEQVATASAETGVAISSLSPGYFANCHPLVEDAALRENGPKLIGECLERCAPVGATGILVPMFPKDFATWEAAAWQTLIDGFKPLAQAAADRGITLCLETMFDAASLERILDGVDSPALTVYYDTANTTNCGYDAPTEIRQLGDRIGMVHVKDTDSSHLGDGRVPWAACGCAIRAIGYNDWFVLETPAGDDPRLSGARNYGFTRGWLVPRGKQECHG